MPLSSVRAHVPEEQASLRVWHNTSVTTGIFSGVSLSVIFCTWVIVANRVPSFDQFALLRNLAAVAVLCSLALVPVLRFWRWPGHLLASSLVGWLIFSVSYRLLCLYFVDLKDRYSAVEVFMLGAVAYMLMVTVSWLGTILWRARLSDETHLSGVDHVNHHTHHHAG
jgi:hypothetical protein